MWELLSQKVVGMRRLLIVLSVPVLTVNLTYFLLHIDFRNISAVSVLRPVVYLLLSISATFVLLHLVTWLSAGIGLKIHSQTKAVLASVAVVTAWTVIPLVIIPLFRFRTPVQELVTTFSPYSAVAATEQYLIEPFMRTNYNPVWTGRRNFSTVVGVLRYRGLCNTYIDYSPGRTDDVPLLTQPT